MSAKTSEKTAKSKNEESKVGGATFAGKRNLIVGSAPGEALKSGDQSAQAFG
jgi:hypothetical protein